MLTAPVSERVEAVAAREGGLRRVLTPGQLSMIAIGGAIGTGLFLGAGLAIGLAGPAVLVSYAIGAVITLLLMGCLAEMTVAHPTEGSFGMWAEVYVSPLAGYLVRWAYWLGIVFALGTEVSAVAVYMGFWLPHVPGVWWIGLVSAALVGLNAMDVRWFGRVEYGFSALKIGAIAGFLLLGGWVVWRAAEGAGVGARNFTAYGGFFPHGAWGTWTAVLVALFSYFSIEMIAIAAGEAKEPERAITRAFRATMVRLVLFYLLTLALVLALAPWTETATGGRESPFVAVMARVGMHGAAGMVNAVLLVAAVSAMNSQLYIATRMLFSLSRARYVPRALGELNGRGVPARALVVSSAGIGLAAVLNAWIPGKAFTVMLAVSMFGPLFTWAMVFGTHLMFRRRYKGKLVFRMWGYPWASFAGLGLMVAAILTTPFTAVFRPTLWYGVPLIGILCGVYRLQGRRNAVP